VTPGYNTARILETNLRKSDGSILNAHSCVYNQGHQRTRQTRTCEYRYDPFGRLRYQYNEVASGYRFSPKEFHGPSGMYACGFRYYDPHLQRWVNRDPIEEHGALNLYAVVGNNPNELADRLGLYQLDQDGVSLFGTGAAFDTYFRELGVGP
jgi:RHS repeat-associated protein